MMTSRHPPARPTAPAWRSERGSELVEFSLSATILFLLMFAIFQCGFGLFALSSLNNGVRDGARFGAVHPADTAGITSNVINHLSFADNATVGVAVAYPDGSTNSGNRIQVTLTYGIPVFLPGLTLGTVSRSSTMRIE